MSDKKIQGAMLALIWIISLAVVLGGFYGLDHFIMGVQGLPLNADLTPAG